MVFLLGVAATCYGAGTHENINVQGPRLAPNQSESVTLRQDPVPVEPGLQIPPDPGIMVAPPAIKFDPWHLVRSTDTSEEYSVTFPSAMTTEFEPNNKVPLRVFIPTDRQGPVPVVILLHYWGATDTGVEASMAEQLCRRGVAGIVVSLPYHMSRTPKGYRSGQLAIQPDPAKLVVTMTQCVWDIRRTIDWIQSSREFDPNRIGISGTSLGAIVASLSFGIDTRITAGCFMLGGADLAHILWNSSRVVSEREALRRRGYTEERMRDALKVIEPSTYLHPGDRRTFIVGAKHDTVIPPADVEKLIQALRPPESAPSTSAVSPDVLWLDTGHYGGVFVERQLGKLMSSFFDASFRGRDYKAPKTLFAPTLRIGLDVTPPNGLQVAVGVDVWRWSRNADGFGAILLTPRGFQGFLGYNISSGLALGITFLPKRTTVGAFWSVVL